MGGYGSGRSVTRPAVEYVFTISLPLTTKRGWIKDGACSAYGSLTWITNCQHRTKVNYSYDMTDPELTVRSPPS